MPILFKNNFSQLRRRPLVPWWEQDCAEKSQSFVCCQPPKNYPLLVPLWILANQLYKPSLREHSIRQIRKNSERPLTPPPSFRQTKVNFDKNVKFDEKVTFEMFSNFREKSNLTTIFPPSPPPPPILWMWYLIFFWTKKKIWETKRECSDLTME